MGGEYSVFRRPILPAAMKWPTSKGKRGRVRENEGRKGLPRFEKNSGYGPVTILKMAAVRRPQSWIFEIGSFCHVDFVGMPLCFPRTKFR